MKFFYILLGLLWSSLSRAQTITVTDAETGAPVTAATLTSERPAARTQTNEAGQASLAAFQDASAIVIQAPGYQTTTISYETLAQQAFGVRLKLTGMVLEEIVVSANRTDERQSRVLPKIQVLRGSEIQQMNQSSTADVLSQSGNVLVQKSQQGGGSPIIRGFEANKVLIVVDGIRMNNAIYRGGHLQNVITLDNAVMERAELVFGPGSVVYGSDALGGVMHFYTRNPVLATGDSVVVHAQAYTRYQSAASGYAAHGQVSVGGRRLGSLTAVTVSDIGDLRQGRVRTAAYPDFGLRPWYVDRIAGRDSMVQNPDPDVQVGSGYAQADFLQKVVFRQSDRITHLLNLQYSTSTDIPRYDRLTLSSGGNPRFAEWYYGPQERLLLAYSLSLRGLSWYDQARIVAGYQQVAESRHTRRFRATERFSQMEQLDILTLNIDLDKMAGKHHLRYGAEYWWNEVNSTAQSLHIITEATGPADTRYPDGGAIMQAGALYLTHTVDPRPDITLHEGIRFTRTGLDARFADTTFFPFPFDAIVQRHTALNGTLGLIVRPGTGWRVSLGAASGFRAPNVDDLAKVFESVPGNLIVPNPDIRPEYTYNGEISLSKVLHDRVTLSATGYYTRYVNALTTQPATLNGQDSVVFDGQLSRVSSVTNAGRAYIWGAEGQVSANLGEKLAVSGTVVYTYGRIRTDTTAYPLDHIPPLFGRVRVHYAHRNVQAAFFVQYSGWKRVKDYNLIGEDNYSYATPDGMPAWYTLNARCTWQFLPYLSLQVACENILDRNYRVFASNISAPGRNVIVTLRYQR